MLGDRAETRDALWQIASHQRGYFTAGQASEVGYSYQAQRFHTQRGNWLRVDRGLYRFREFMHLPSEGDDHFVRWSLWSRGRAVVSHASSLSAHDLGIANPDQIHLTVPRGFRQKNPAVLLHRAELRPDEIEQRTGYQLTTPLRAIAESAGAGVDQDIIAAAVADLLTRGEGTKRQLLRAAGQMGPEAELSIERALRGNT